MWRAGPSAPRKKGICEAEKTFDLQKTGKLYQRLTRFQVATERCRNSCESAIRCRFLPPSGQPKGYRSCSLRTATCPRNNRQPVNSEFNSLETNRFEHVDIIMINQYIMLIVTFFGYFWYGDSLHDLLKASGFDACAKNIQKHTSCIHVVSQTRCQAVSRTGLETWSPASAWEVLAPIQQPIVTTSAKGRQGRSRLPFSFSGPLMSSVNSTCST